MRGMLDGFDVRVYRGRRARSTLGGPGVLAVAGGELIVRPAPDADAIRMVNGDVALVEGDRRVECREGARLPEVICFEAEHGWVARVCALSGHAASSRGDAFTLHRASTDVARQIRSALRELAAGHASDGEVPVMRRFARGVELLSFALESPGGPPVTAPDAGARRRDAFLAAVAALEAGPLDDVSLASLAGSLGLSERQASRRFRELMGRSFRDHFVALRLGRAKRLLRETEQPVIDVALATGWRSLAHFNVVFRERVGVTPSAFRRRT